MSQTIKPNPDFITPNGNQTSFNQSHFNPNTEVASSDCQWKKLPGYKTGKRAAEEGIICSEVTGNGRFYM